ncbi:conserved hypothetical protein [Talaromyces stipitatus ATCC 10500]|uniref:Uncharacterized protein n=1 Tax=Talaromyces stipitatus (strain ATCC 10500 / CBS 375.48 / QM 6759 / NRRL 1006) TaxID=441959 RepID=B8MQV1_TALSN|nr:uncharacterized protein TSTA_053040 [Talaromyces stipitatus ATCC 10500]EED12786.1 conserved hypothetical protein [Talaromyces stipitatus ATCC 10500]
MAPEDQGKQFVFVGGPMLIGKSKDGLRSKLAREGMREKRLEARKIAMAEINRLLTATTTTTTTKCSCRRESRIDGPAVRCSFCSRRNIRPYYYPWFTGDGDSSSVYDLASGLLDPMMPINELTSRLKVGSIFSFACRHIFPNLRSLDMAGIYQTWAFPFDDDELKLYAFLWSSKYHENLIRLTYGAPEDPAALKEELILKGLTLRALRKEVGNYTGQKPIDSIIRCMLVLAVNEKDSERIYREPSPFAPVFTGLHGLEVYGGRDFSPLHWMVMYKLLQKQGGIKKLRLFALAWHVSASDLTNAAHTLRKPLYPIVDVYGQKLDLDPPLLLFAPYGCGHSWGQRKTPGSGFNELLFMEQPVHGELVIVFCHIGELSYVIDHMSTQSCDAQLLDLLGDSRDLVHHRLFSQPNEDDTSDKILQRLDNGPSIGDTHKGCLELYLTCRLAMLLYSAHVTFPVPRSIAVRQRLLRSLCPKLQSFAVQGFSSPLLLWCTSVALIAAYGTEHFDEVLLLFKKLCCALQVMSLEKLLEILCSFAWVHATVQHHYPKMKGYFLANYEDT